MNNQQSNSMIPVCRSRRKREAGMALVISLLLLLLISAIGLGLLYMSNTETAINGNYRDSQVAFYAMRAGLEETRDRMRTTSPWPIVPPATMPPAANSILYITNPAGAGEVVAPTVGGSAYFDDEFCHETFVGDNLASPGANIPCSAGSGPPVGWTTTVNSISPNTTTNSALKYKWARITLKENGSFANGVATAYVDATQAANTQVCYQTLPGQEIPITQIAAGAYANCTAAQNAGVDASPVYVVTTLAVTPQGSRRVGQYEIAAVHISTPPVALGLDGPGAIFSPTPSSNNTFMNGVDSGLAGYTSSGGTGACIPTGPAVVPAITVGDATGVNNIDTQLQGPPNRTTHYTGTGPTPSVVNGGSTTFSGAWSTPSQLDSLVASIADVADTTYTCGISTPCSPGGSVGTIANPQITYVNGDFNYGNASGAGVLVVTGTLSFSGNAAFNGLILVIGQGAIVESGGGNGGFNGSVFLAKTQSSTFPYPELATLGTPTISWNGGGNSFIQYNSCWASVGNGTRYTPVATREEMY